MEEEGVISTLLKWFTALPKTVQAGGAALTLLTAGSVLTLSTLGFAGLPAVVEANTEAIQELRDYRYEDSRVVLRMLCILELQVEIGDDQITPLAVQRRCP